MKKTLSIISGISFVISGIATVVAFVCFCICQISQVNEYAMFGEFMYKEMLLNITLVLAGLSLGMLVLFVVQVKCSPDRKKFAVAFAALLVVAGIVMDFLTYILNGVLDKIEKNIRNIGNSKLYVFNLYVLYTCTTLFGSNRSILYAYTPGIAGLL